MSNQRGRDPRTMLPIMGGSDAAASGQTGDQEPPDPTAQPFFNSLPAEAQAALRAARDDAAKHRVRAREWEQKVTGWGGEDAVQEAIRTRQALNTDQGMLQLTSEAVSALREAGMTNKEIGELLDIPVAEVKEAVKPGESTTDESSKPLTRAEFQSLMKDYMEQRQQETEETQSRRLNSVVEDYLTSIDTLDDDDRDWMRLRAKKLWLESGGTPTERAILASLDKAKSAYEAKFTPRKPQSNGSNGDSGQEETLDDFDVATELPKILSGSSPASGAALPAPKSVKEANDMVSRLFNRR